MYSARPVWAPVAYDWAVPPYVSLSTSLATGAGACGSPVSVKIVAAGEVDWCRQKRLEAGLERGIAARLKLLDPRFIPVADQVRIVPRVRRRRRVLNHMHHLAEGLSGVGKRLLARRRRRQRQKLEQAPPSHRP